MSATNNGDGLKPVIIHAAPVFCIQVPTFDTVDASHTARKDGFRNGVHGEAAAAAACGSASSPARSLILILLHAPCRSDHPPVGAALHVGGADNSAIRAGY